MDNAKEFSCPRCGQRLALTTQQLIENDYRAVCTKCGAQLKIVGNYAYMPTEAVPIEPVPPPAPDAAPVPYAPSPGTATLDPLFDDAVRFVATCNAIHVGMLVQYFGISPERAVELMNQLESHGIVGPYQPGRPRRILIPHNANLPSAFKRTQELDEAMRQAQEEAEQQQGNARGCTLQLGRGGCFGTLFLLLLLYILLRMCTGT